VCRMFLKSSTTMSSRLVGLLEKATWDPFMASIWIPREQVSMLVRTAACRVLQKTNSEKLYSALWQISKHPVRNTVKNRSLANLIHLVSCITSTDLVNFGSLARNTYMLALPH
jgi:hypothetical protein